MNNLSIEGFKVFSEAVDILIEDKNMLLYGENGSGKSSIFEAIKIIFLRDVLEKRKISITATPEEEIQLRNDLYNSYNRHSTNPFKIKINNIDYKGFDVR